MMAKVGRSSEGYLVMADIAGYTAFLTGSELEHAHAIIEELTDLIRTRLAPPLRFVKFEGDAVFCYAESGVFTDSERLVELTEVCYLDFSNKLAEMARTTTCTCTACASIGTLDLKFVVHYGTFMVQRDGSSEDLAGPDVILVHRLLKNNVASTTGASAYILFTNACMTRLPQAFALPRHTETIDSFGDVSGGVHDLRPVLEEMRAIRRITIQSKDADLEQVFNVAAPPAVVWDYVFDPRKRQLWACRFFDKNPDKVEPNARGRYSGAGAKSHCGHGPGTVGSREAVDYQPYTFASMRASVATGWMRTRTPIIEAFDFEQRPDGGTTVYHRMRLTDRSLLARIRLRLFFGLLAGAANWQRNLNKAIERGAARRG